jgi:hypothetical protein
MFRGSFLTDMYYVLCDEFVDRINGICNFESQLFIDYINIAAKLPDEYSEYSVDISSLYNPEETFAITIGTFELTGGLSGVSRQERVRQIVLAEYPLKGFPTPPGGSTILRNDDSSQIAIFNTSENITDCWEFIRRFFTSEFQELRPNGMSIAFRRDSQEKRFAALMMQEFDDSTIPITAAELAKLQQLLETPMIRSGWSIDSKTVTDPILGIINEELPAYFAGDKSAGETARIILSRASLYVGEQS